ncbi:MAG: presqualene diphosphate synthase HpnD [Bacteroidota bacterium]
MVTDVAAAITKTSRTSFYYSFSLLPKQKRDAIKTVYAFCRFTDDLVDQEPEDHRRLEGLRRWREELGRALTGTSDHAILNQLAATAMRFRIPVKHFYDLITGVEQDLTKSRYANFRELERYCYHVASTVGLICTEIFGYTNQRAKEYAVNLGIALQLTNIIRDVAADARRDRVYLPREDLDRFGVSEDDILLSRPTPQVMQLIQFQCERAREYFRKADEIFPQEDRALFFPAKIMESIYRQVLNRIEESGYDVFGRKFSIARPHQLWIAVRIWFNHRLLGRS